MPTTKKTKKPKARARPGTGSPAREYSTLHLGALLCFVRADRDAFDDLPDALDASALRLSTIVGRVALLAGMRRSARHGRRPAAPDHLVGPDRARRLVGELLHDTFVFAERAGVSTELAALEMFRALERYDAKRQAPHA